ncbi:MAG: relaxase/mobilization nuclease domain-containing protein [Rikenellaceae bacterium]|jgi:hypothetical protein|nr:relaxase/mobilization nuclease domain-containing protein [Rikenellaceae bacterium]
MIAKNKKGKSFGGCVRYVMNESAEVLAAEGMMADNAASIIRDFAIQRSGRPEIKQPVGHIAVSFSPEDAPRLTGDFMLKLAHEYMAEMGIGNTQYIVVRHHNTDHDHFHIVYNRIDNDLKLISVNNDYRRNVAACKKLKDRHGLTYGTGKEKVNRPKLTGADKVKYQIHDEIAANLPKCATYIGLEQRLRQAGITVQYKYRRGAEESPENIQGVSFEKGGMIFKGSDIDRKFSHANLKKALSINLNEAWERMKDEIIPEVKPRQKPSAVQSLLPVTLATEQPKPSTLETQTQPKPPRPAKKNHTIAGVQLTDEQWASLRLSEHIFVEGLEKTDGSGKFSAYLFMNDDRNRILSSTEDPDKFVKYGQYEMRLRDKMLVENGHITRATVKWWGGGTARPYLWKENPGDAEYKESWDHPNTPKEQIEKEKRERENRYRHTITPPKKGSKQSL